MSADYFLLGDRDSRDFKVYLHNPNGVRQRPFSSNIQYSSEKITGRDGEVLFDQWYASKTIKLDCFCLYDTENEYLEIEKMKSWLNRIGTKKLSLSYELQRYRNVIVTSVSDLSDYGNQGSMFTITINSLIPFAFTHFTTKDIGSGMEYDTFYYDSGILYAEEYAEMYTKTDITTGQTLSLYNAGTYTARPNFIFDGIATTLLVEQYSDSGFTSKIDQFSYDTSFNGELQVNSLLSNTYFNDVITASIDGDYPSMIGEDYDSELRSNFIESASSLNEVKLDENASASDDYYNDKVIYLKKGIQTYVRTITDYNGTTKIATLDNDLPLIIDYTWDYSIVDIDGGMSYFKITGTGFSSLDVTVDFRFTYI